MAFVDCRLPFVFVGLLWLLFYGLYGFCGFLAVGFSGRPFKHQRQQSQQQRQQHRQQKRGKGALYVDLPPAFEAEGTVLPCKMIDCSPSKLQVPWKLKLRNIEGNLPIGESIKFKEKRKQWKTNGILSKMYRKKPAEKLRK